MDANQHPHVHIEYTDSDLFDWFTNGATLRELHKKTNYQPATIARRLKRYNPDLYEFYASRHKRARFDESKAIELRKKGLSLRAISDAVEVPKSTLGDYFKIMKIGKVTKE